MPTHLQKKNEKPHTLVGTWFNADEYETDVEYIVSRAGGSFAVRAVDRFDGEEGEVYDVKWDGDALSFAVHWNSTGRLVKARLLAISPNRVDYTYTYTQQETWHRKETEALQRTRLLHLGFALGFLFHLSFLGGRWVVSHLHAL